MFYFTAVPVLSWLPAAFFFFFSAWDNMYMGGKIFEKFSWPLAVVLEINQCHH